MTITLIGYMGSGKSTIGLHLSQLLNFKFVDLDSFIEETEGKSIPELFKEKGEIQFRKIESRLLTDVLTLRDTIISLGGGTPCYGENMQHIIASEVKSIYLRSTVATLASRLQTEMEDRPLISHLKTMEELNEFIGKHLFERSQFYIQSDLSIAIDGKSVEEIALEIQTKLF